MVIDDEWEATIEKAFSGWSNAEKLSERYKGFGDTFIKTLVDGGHDVSAYLALSAFIDELLSDIMEQELYTEEASNTEKQSLRKMNTRAKADLLRVTGVIDKDSRNQIREFWKYRNKFAHEASEHVYSEEDEQNLKNGFKQGLRAYDYLLELHPESFEINLNLGSGE